MMFKDEGIKIYAKMGKWDLDLPIRYIATELPMKSNHGNDLDSDSSIRIGFSRQFIKGKPISRQFIKKKAN